MSSSGQFRSTGDASIGLEECGDMSLSELLFGNNIVDSKEDLRKNKSGFRTKK